MTESLRSRIDHPLGRIAGLDPEDLAGWREDAGRARSVRHFAPPRRYPRPAPKRDDLPVYLPDGADPESVPVRKTRNPAPSATLGRSGIFVDLDDEAWAGPGTLVLPVGERLQRESASCHVVRWNEVARALDPVDPCPGSQEAHVWARITAPGKYGVIGLPAGEAERAALGMLAATKSLADDLEPERRSALHDAICAAIREHASSDDARTRCASIAGPFDSPELQLLHGRKSPADTWARVADVSVRDPSGAYRLGAISCLLLEGRSPTRLYVGSTWGGLWRLDDVARFPSEAAWSQLGGPEGPNAVRAVAVISGERDRIYAADAFGAIHGSDDGGSTWTKSLVHHGHATPVRLLAGGVEPDRLLLAARGSHGGVWSSRDGGARWRHVLKGDVQDAALGPSPARRVLAAVTGEGVLESLDSGESWHRSLAFVSRAAHRGARMSIEVGPVDDDGQAPVAAAFGQELFLASTHGHCGESPLRGRWKSRGPLGSSFGDGPQLAFDPFDSTLVATGQRLLRGTHPWTPSSWRAISEPPPRLVGFGAASKGLIVMTTAAGALVRSDDGGETWDDLGDGLEIGEFISPVSDGKITLAHTSSGELVGGRPEGGDEWALLNDAPLFARAFPDPGARDTIYVLGERLMRLRRRRGGLTVDPAGDFVPTCATISSVPEVPLLVGSEDRIMRLFRTPTAKEARWDDPGLGWSESPIAQIALSPGEPRAATALSETGRTFRLARIDQADWGAWEEIGSDGPKRALGLDINALDPALVYALADGEIWRSTDGGRTWKHLASESADAQLPGRVVALLTHPRNTETLFAATDVGVFVSGDRGLAWQSYGRGLPRGPVSGLTWVSDELLAGVLGWGLWRRGVRL